MLINRLLKAGCDVYWLKKEETATGRSRHRRDLGAGFLSREADARQGREGTRHPRAALAKAPAGEALKLKPIRIGLYDPYGGIMPSGWTRWLFEQYEFPFEVVYPHDARCGRSEEQVRRAGVRRRRGRARPGSGGRGGGGGGGGRGGRTRNRFPTEYRDRLGRISEDKTMPQLKKFVEPADRS